MSEWSTILSEVVVMFGNWIYIKSLIYFTTDWIAVVRYKSV